jgi:putative phosphoesterase
VSLIKIGVLADTHLTGPGSRLKQAVDQYFDDTELILHAGDIITLDVLEAFGNRPFHAVSGNWDRPEVRAKFTDKKVLEINGFKIGLIHGWGSPFGIDQRVASQFYDADCVVFGHSHWTFNQKKGGVLLFNPGTFRGDLFSFWKKTIGILSVDRDIKGEIIRL